ncbi:hypothetical protein GCM10010359_42340 [Streptomyces morookaense]|nr:hypothetical protein GCM10010359_42340 [Streptomyces morookaense]
MGEVVDGIAGQAQLPGNATELLSSGYETMGGRVLPTAWNAEAPSVARKID